ITPGRKTSYSDQTHEPRPQRRSDEGVCVPGRNYRQCGNGWRRNIQIAIEVLDGKRVFSSAVGAPIELSLLCSRRPTGSANKVWVCEMPGHNLPAELLLIRGRSSVSVAKLERDTTSFEEA